MAHSNELYEEIMKAYDQRRSARDRLIRDRKQELENKVPGYRELEDESRSLLMKIASGRVTGSVEGKGSYLRKRVSELRRKQKECITQSGFPEDYLNPPYGCSKCQDTGFLEDGSPCPCLVEKKRELLYDQSNIRKLISVDNFSKLSEEYYKGEDLHLFRLAADKCREFCDTFEENQTNLFLYGSPGSGKSFLSCCIAERILNKGIGVIYYSSQQFFDTLFKQTFYRNEELEQSLGDSTLLEIPLLIIDDLGTELGNSWSEPGLFSCINYRQISGFHTIISTNLSLEELRDRYRDRIFSRIMGYYEVLHISGPDIRLKKKSRRMQTN